MVIDGFVGTFFFCFGILKLLQKEQLNFGKVESYRNDFFQIFLLMGNRFRSIFRTQSDIYGGAFAETFIKDI